MSTRVSTLLLVIYYEVIDLFQKTPHSPYGTVLSRTNCFSGNACTEALGITLIDLPLSIKVVHECYHRTGPLKASFYAWIYV